MYTQASFEVYNGEPTVIYYDLTSDFAQYRIGGTIPWRNNNPGDLKAGNNEIGTAQGFRIFPDYETGFAELERQMSKEEWSEYSIVGLIRKKSPGADHNNPEAYAAELVKDINKNNNNGEKTVTVNTIMKTLTQHQIHNMCKSIQQQEGYNDHQGRVEFHKVGRP